MDIYKTINLLKIKLEDGNKASSDLLFGVYVESDPYADFTKRLPLVLIEADRTDFTNTAQGYVVNQEHNITLTCIESAQNILFDKYKSKINKLAKSTIDKLMTIEDYNIQKITPTDLSHDEIMIGSLKASAVVIGVKVKTYWKDN